jgi:TonB family protein
MGVAVKSVAILGAAAIVALVLRRRSAAARHLVWTTAFAATLVLPFLSAALPALRVPLPSATLLPAAPDFRATASASAGAPSGQASPAGLPVSRTAPWRPAWRTALVPLWAAGAIVGLSQMLLGYIVAWRVRRTGCQWHGDSAVVLASTLGISRAVPVVETPPGSMPMTFGLRRATILMPANAATWSEEKRRMVLLHELAHVRRGDAATQLLARTALSLYWWNPLAWTAWREFLKERERATDDLVLKAGTAAPDYAGQLLEVARGMRGSSIVACAAPSMARRSQLEGRLLAILDSGVNRTAPGRAWVLGAAFLAVAAILPLAAVRAQDPTAEAVPADGDAAIREARSRKDFKTLDSAAQAATRQAKYETARKFAEAALAIRGEVDGEQSIEYGLGLVKLGEVEQKIDSKSGVDLYAKAAQIVGDRPEAAGALTHLGVTALNNRDFPKAFESFDLLLHVAPANAGMALMWMAVVRQNEKSFDDADKLYQSALAAQDPNSSDARVIRAVFSSFLRSQGRTDQADQLSSVAAEKIAAKPTFVPDGRTNRAGQLSPVAAEKSAAKPTIVPDGVYRVGNGTTAPRVDSKVEPKYSEEARAAKLQGTVVLSVIVGTDGIVHDAQILRGVGLGLDENAIEAVNQWRFKPGAREGQPVKIRATIEVNFRLL